MYSDNFNTYGVTNLHEQEHRDMLKSMRARLLSKQDNFDEVLKKANVSLITAFALTGSTDKYVAKKAEAFLDSFLFVRGISFHDIHSLVLNELSYKEVVEIIAVFGQMAQKIAFVKKNVDYFLQRSYVDGLSAFKISGMQGTIFKDQSSQKYIEEVQKFATSIEGACHDKHSQQFENAEWKSKLDSFIVEMQNDHQEIKKKVYSEFFSRDMLKC